MPPPPFEVACPASIANYDFDVIKIELTLQAIAANTVSGDAGLKVPIIDASLGPDFNGSRAHTRTTTIILDRPCSTALRSWKDFMTVRITGT